MKLNALILFIGFSNLMFSQEVFSENGKYGISSYGDASDSIWHQPIYDKIETYIMAEAFVYTGLINDHWTIIHSNIDSSEVTYDYFMEDLHGTNLLYGFKDGLCDIYECKGFALIAENIRASKVSDEVTEAYYGNRLLVTLESKEGIGLFDADHRKLLIEPVYQKIKFNDNEENYFIVSNKAGTGFLDSLGNVIMPITENVTIKGVEPIDSVAGAYKIIGKNRKKGEGFYSAKNDYFIEPIYKLVDCLYKDDQCVVVYSKKGEGLYFKGKKVLDCEYDIVSKTNLKGFIAEANKGYELFYVTEEGELQTENEAFPESEYD